MTIESDARFWDRSSRRYAGSAVADPDGYEQTIRCTRLHLQPDARVIELGCGTGTTALRLADAVSSYLATDLSSEMIAIAETKLTASSVENLSFRVAAAEDLIDQADRFDAVLGFNFLHLVRDLPSTLHSIHRLLKPGGLFISKTPCLGDMRPLLRWLLLPVMRAVRLAPHTSSFGQAGLEQRIVEAGFHIILRETHASTGNDRRPYIVATKR